MKNLETLKTAPVEIDGKTWLLTYDFNAIVEAEAEAECNLLTALENLNRLTAKQLRALLWAMIVVTPPARAPTLTEAGELVRIDTIGPITTALAIAIVQSRPAKPEPVIESSPE